MSERTGLRERTGKEKGKKDLKSRGGCSNLYVVLKVCEKENCHCVEAAGSFFAFDAQALVRKTAVLRLILFCQRME